MTNIYFWCTGQDDNIGDIVLRRRLLRAISVPGCRVVVYVGKGSAGFLDSLGVPSERTMAVTSRVRWLLSMCASAIGGRTVLVHNAGEIQLDSKTIQSQAALLPPQLLVRLRGGAVLRTGCAVQDRSDRTGRIAGALVKILGRSTTRSTWRDTESSLQFGDSPMVPDWAFDETRDGPVGQVQRSTVVITFRADRPPLSDKALHEISLFAEEHALDVRTVVQVRRDNDAMQALADQLGCAHVGWPPERGHKEQEAVIRAEFAGARIVISDRIHALIIGCTEGSIPAAVMAYPDRKVGRHFDAAGLYDIVLDGSDQYDNDIRGFLSGLLGRSEELNRSWGGARHRVRELDEAISADVERLGKGNGR